MKLSKKTLVHINYEELESIIKKYLESKNTPKNIIEATLENEPQTLGLIISAKSKLDLIEDSNYSGEVYSWTEAALECCYLLERVKVQNKLKQKASEFRIT